MSGSIKLQENRREAYSFRIAGVEADNFREAGVEAYNIREIRRKHTTSG